MSKTATVATKTSRDIETQYLIAEITTKFIRGNLSSNYIQEAQTQAENRKLWMVTLFILELNHEINKNEHFRERCLKFLFKCDDELTLLHMLTTRSHNFNEIEIMSLVLKLVRHASPDTINICAQTSSKIPDGIKKAMAIFI